jgi:hypothetical protein
VTRALRLEGGTFELDFANWATHGIVVSTVDLGFPAVREVLTDLPTQDGSLDQTAFVGPRVITITGNFGPCTNGSRGAARNALAPFVAPGARSTFIIAPEDDADEMAFTVRAMDFQAITAQGTTTNFTASWKAADPLAYGQSINEVDLRPTTGGSAGRTYPKTYPRSYPPTLGGGGTAYITTQGNYSTFPVIEIFGPASNPTIQWLDPYLRTPLGPQIVFTGLSIASTDHLTIDTRARTVVLNDDPNASRYSFLDFAATTWAPLAAGLNLLWFSSPAAPPPAIAKVFWQDASLI